MATLAETIRELTREHLLHNNGALLAQAVTAVGFIGGTVPDDLPENKGIIELPVSDCSNSAIAVGFALMGRRPIYVCRYQGFMWYNAASIVNYAAKSKELWDVPCPIFVRALAMEGGIGPVAGGMHHSMIMRMPGIRVVAPMTPQEYHKVWQEFVEGDSPVYCSEHRKSYGITEPMFNTWGEFPEINIFAIGSARLSAIEAQQKLEKIGYCTNLIHIYKLKPLEIPKKYLYYKGKPLNLVVDGDYTQCGAAEHISQYISDFTLDKVYVMGLRDVTAGFSPDTDNVTPTADEIVNKVRSLL